MILLVGESGSGKSSIERYLCEHYGFEKVITCTTRPMRDGEVDGVDYHFLSTEEFDKKVADGEFVEHAEYRGWKYGTLREDCFGDKKILVVTPHGLRTMKRELVYEWVDAAVALVSFYISVDRRSRLMKLLERGDDIEEAYRRSLSDVGMFDGIEDEVDFVIKNDGYKYKINLMGDWVLGQLKGITTYLDILEAGENAAKGFQAGLSEVDPDVMKAAKGLCDPFEDGIEIASIPDYKYLRMG